MRTRRLNAGPLYGLSFSSWKRLNIFDKICGVFAFGVVLLLARTFDLCIGVRAWFTLPPVLGLLPAFVGWGIVRAVYFAWRAKKNGEAAITKTCTRWKVSPACVHAGLNVPFEIYSPPPSTASTTGLISS